MFNNAKNCFRNYIGMLLKSNQISIKNAVKNFSLLYRIFIFGFYCGNRAERKSIKDMEL